MGVLTSTSLRQGEFEEQMDQLGLQAQDKKEVERAAAVAAVKASSYVLQHRREKPAELGFRCGD